MEKNEMFLKNSEMYIEDICPTRISIDWVKTRKSHNVELFHVIYEKITSKSYNYIKSNGTDAFIYEKPFNYNDMMDKKFSSITTYVILAVISAIITIILWNSTILGGFGALVTFLSPFITLYFFVKYLNLKKSEKSFFKSYRELKTFYSNILSITKVYTFNEFNSLLTKYQSSHSWNINSFVTDLSGNVRTILN